MTKTLSVAAIKNGTVIDHIPAGQGLKIIHLLKINSKKHRATLGLNLTSKSIGLKDLIKIEGRFLQEHEANEVTVFAPKATINIIENFEVIKKINTRLPEAISEILVCPNKNCITHFEPIATCFFIEEYRNSVKLHCKYCEKPFQLDEIKECAQ
jgi:aspartate carbamoyltransferase regulatory subunit